MEHYRSAHSIPLHDLAFFAQQHVTQIAQNTARTVDKAAERCIIVRSFVRSFVSTNCTPHATIPFFSSHNMHTGRNVCIAYGDARRYGVVELLECNHPRGTLKTPRVKYLARRRFSPPTMAEWCFRRPCRNVQGKYLARRRFSLPTMAEWRFRRPCRNG